MEDGSCSQADDQSQLADDTVDHLSGHEPYLSHQMPSASLATYSGLKVAEEDDLFKKIDTVRRNQWMTLKEKRCKKAEIVLSDSLRAEHTLGVLRVAKYSLSMSYQKFWEALRGFAYTFELWYSDLKLIEGNFGSGVTTYFKFLRWVFLLNFVMLIICFGFLVLPQILFTIYGESSYQGVSSKFYLQNLVTGEGFLTNTSLYYGSYTNKTIELVEGYSYSIPNAYFFSLFSCYLLFFIVVSYSMAHSYRTSFIETKGGQNNVHALKVFCGWDFSIATKHAALLNQKHVYNEIKEVLTEAGKQDQEYSCFFLFTNSLIHASLNLMFILLLAGTGFLMWDLLERHFLNLSQTDGTNNTMMMAIFISVVMNFLPKGFSWIVRYEGFQNPRYALYVTLLRTFLLNCVMIGVLLSFWLQNSSSSCWQTSLGQEVYRLVVTDFIISIIIMEVINLSWCWLSKKYFNGSGCFEFDIAWNSLNIIYNQTLLMVGLYFSPLLIALVVLKLFITFYVKKVGIFLNAEASKSWKAAQTETVFLILTFNIILGVFLLLGYVLIEIPASSCGPFRGTGNTYKIVIDSILQLENDDMFWKVVMFLVKPGVVAAVLVGMSGAAYLLRARAHAHSILANILLEMVISEAKDKAFLFKYVQTLEKIGSIPPVLSTSSSHNAPLCVKKLINPNSVKGGGRLDYNLSTKEQAAPSQSMMSSTSYIL